MIKLKKVNFIHIRNSTNMDQLLYQFLIKLVQFYSQNFTKLPYKKRLNLNSTNSKYTIDGKYLGFFH